MHCAKAIFNHKIIYVLKRERESVMIRVDTLMDVRTKIIDDIVVRLSYESVRLVYKSMVLE